MVEWSSEIHSGTGSLSHTATWPLNLLMFADVVIPRTRLDALTYVVPDALCSKVQVGSAVKVELRSKPVPGIVLALNETCPQFGVQQSAVRSPQSAVRSDVKPILELVEPAYCPADLLLLLDWVSRYYLASWGETLSLALPGKTIGYKPRKPWQPPRHRSRPVPRRS